MMKAALVHEIFRRLPVGALDAILPGTTLLLAPHADDESLGCGGLIAALCAAGRPPLVVVLTDGAASHPASADWPPERLARQRRLEAIRAAALLGLPPDRLHFLGLPDTRSPQAGPDLDRAVSRLSAIPGAPSCASVLTSWFHDPHCDHQSAWRIGQALAASHGMALLAYPVWGWLIEPEQDIACAAPKGWRFDIARHRRTKLAAIAAHESQYGGLITDDPGGFVLPEALLSACDGDYETVLMS